MQKLQWKASEFKTGTTQCKRCKTGFYYAVGWGDDTPKICNNCKKALEKESEELLKNPPKEYRSDSMKELSKIERITIALCAILVIAFIAFVIL